MNGSRTKVVCELICIVDFCLKNRLLGFLHRFIEGFITRIINYTF